ncbi:MAG: hypothetical protein JRK53_18980 [Deltaproteobacteria bacterium]|nr:hypothetical protein [Deltaproteobacteria bacterium]
MKRQKNRKNFAFDKPGNYRIRVNGIVSESWGERLGGMRIETRSQGDQEQITTIIGRVRDQAELAGVLDTLYELHLPLLSVENLPDNDDGAGNDPNKSSPGDPGGKDSTE